MKKSTKIFLACWAAITVLGILVAPSPPYPMGAYEASFRFGYGVAFGIWVPLVYFIYLAGRKLYIVLTRENA